MNWFLNVILIVFFAVFQTTVMPEISIKFGIANIIFVIFVCLLFLRYFELSLVWAALGGLVLDFLSSTPAGLFFFSFIIIYFVLATFLKILEFREFLALLVIIFVSSILLDLLMISYLNIAGLGLSIGSFYNIIILDSVLNVIFICIVYPILIYINRHFSAKKEKEISLSGLYE